MISTPLKTVRRIVFYILKIRILQILFFSKNFNNTKYDFKNTRVRQNCD